MILDTNALSAWFDGDEALLDVMVGGRTMLPVIVIGEYRYGVRGSAQRREREGWLDRVLAVAQTLPVTLHTTDAYADIRLRLRHKGLPIPVNDLWIAALAVQHAVPVVSRDKHFDVVEGLHRISW